MVKSGFNKRYFHIPNRPFQAKLPCAVPGLSLSRWYRKSGSLKVNCSGMAVRLNANVLGGSINQIFLFIKGIQYVWHVGKTHRSSRKA